MFPQRLPAVLSVKGSEGSTGLRELVTGKQAAPEVTSPIHIFSDFHATVFVEQRYWEQHGANRLQPVEILAL